MTQGCHNVVFPSTCWNKLTTLSLQCAKIQINISFLFRKNAFLPLHSHVVATYLEDEQSKLIMKINLSCE